MVVVGADAVVVVDDVVVDEDEVEGDVGAVVSPAATVVPLDPLLQAAATNMKAAATARTRIDMISLSVRPGECTHQKFPFQAADPRPQPSIDLSSMLSDSRNDTYAPGAVAVAGTEGGSVRLNQVTVPSTNIGASVRFYTTLGLIQIVGEDGYARFVCPDGETTFSVNEVTRVGSGTSPVVYFECDDLDGTVRDLKDAGLVFESDPTDQGWLWREARLMDPDGNEICLYFAGNNRLDPPWKLSRP